MAFKRSAVRSRLSPPKTDHEAKPCGLFPYKNENRTPTGYKDKSRLQFRHGIVVGFYPCIYRIKLASCTENFRQVAGENLPPRRKGPPVMGSASRSGWQSVGSVIVVGNRDAILGQNSLQQLSAFQVKV